MKVKAKEDFKYYRCNVLGLEKKDFRALQAGKIVDIDKELYNKYSYLYEIQKEAQKEVKKNGDKQ